MGNQQSSGAGGGPGGDDKNKKDKKDKPKYEPPPQPTTRIGRKKKKAAGPSAAAKLPAVYPTARCKLRYLRMQRIHDHLLLEEEYVENQERLRKAKAAASSNQPVSPGGEADDRNADERSRVDDMRGSPMGVGNLEELIDDDHAIVSSATGPEYYVSIMSFVDKDLLEPGASILLHHKSVSVVGVLTEDSDPLVSVMKLDKAPTESYADIGGLEQQIQEVREAVELPLLHPELYEEMGIKPPKGVILYGAPGTGKTLLAKAVANQTSATFLRIVGSELIQKYLGDGPRLVRQLFTVAAENAPSIVFIDEIDAIGTKRYESTSGGEREIQRTMLELLNQLDGFDDRGDVKVIMATNKIDTLDPALIRPGRIDRKILFENPDQTTKKKIFTLHTSKMSLNDDVDLDEFISQKDDLSGADIKAICSEAGLMALRERRMRVNMEDFRTARERVLKTKSEGEPEGLYFAYIVDDSQGGRGAHVQMNVPPTEAQMEVIAHLNRGQKRAFLLRDQLRYLEPQHLDTFLGDIAKPEPPSYRRTSSGVQPPFAEVFILDKATSFDLSNVELKDKSVRRVHLTYEAGVYEWRESEPLPRDEDNLDTVPMNVYVARDMIKLFQTKYEAIHERMQSVNETRRYMFEAAKSKPPKKRFSEGKLGEVLRKREREPGELIARHPLNKKKKISFKDISENVKTESVTRLPDDTKIQLFNAFIKSAFPNFDSLMVASWNVVSVYVHAGSDDKELHDAIGDLHEILMEFDSYFDKTKKTQRPDLRNDPRNEAPRKVITRQDLGGPDGNNELSAHNHLQGRLVELSENGRGEADEDKGAALSFDAVESRRSNGRFEAEHRPVVASRQHRAAYEQHDQSQLRRHANGDRSATKQVTSHGRPSDRPLPRTLDELMSQPSGKKYKPRNTFDSLSILGSSAEEEFRIISKQCTPPVSQPLTEPSASPSKKSPANRDHREHVQPAPEGLSFQQQSQRYGMFSNQHRDDDLDDLFMDDNEEAIEMPAMEEVHEQEERPAIYLGTSKLGAPKKPLNASGAAPVAPMMHNSAKGDPERRAH
ncbi:ATPase of 26S proteasome regulatory subunit 4 [Kalmusia sp. IMI 367209]|nr:ATPase of 26S proteasome regulatory subunit 4 [Kalmusia sp. IMI 367209]